MECIELNVQGARLIRRGVLHLLYRMFGQTQNPLTAALPHRGCSDLKQIFV